MIFISLIISSVEHLYLCLLAISMSSLKKKISYLVFCPFFIGLLSYIELYESFVYFRYLNYLSFGSFANTFSQSIGCLYTLFIASFAVQKLLGLIRSHLFIFAFISFALGVWPKKILLLFISKILLLMFSSRSFMLLSLIFRSLPFWDNFYIWCEGVF